jgi:rare lipoprotein A (peptidoglycan hydrolase)
VVLTAVAVLAAVIGLALAKGRTSGGSGLPEAASRWYAARAFVRAPAAYGTETACGRVVGPAAEGVAHPVLPCGQKLYVSFGGKTVLTQVIDRVPNVAPREFDVTAALAQRLGLRGTAEIRWTYARTS